MATNLNVEFEYYLQNQEAIVSKYNGKFVVIKDQQIIGAYDTALSAVLETEKKFPRGTFLVQKAEPGNKAYTQNFHSRVAFG